MDEDGEATPSARKRSRGSTTKKTKRPKSGDPGYDPYDYASSEGEEDTPPSPQSQEGGARSHDQGEEPMDTGEGGDVAPAAPVTVNKER